MSTRHIPYPDDFDVNFHHDVAWQRQQMALKSLAIEDVLTQVDELILAEVAPEQHPLFSMVATALDRRVQCGSAESLQSRYGKLIDFAIEKLVEQRLSDPTAWEVD